MSRAVERARAFEAQGDISRAAAAYLEAGELESAARVLMVGQRFREAADLLMRDLAHVENFSVLSGTLRRRAFQAALAYSKAGEGERSAFIYRKLGDPVRAREVLGVDSDRHTPQRAALAQKAPEKARLLLEAGDPTGAARAFLNTGMPYEAAECYQQAGEQLQALDALMKLPRTHRRYREACVQAITIAVEHDLLDFKLDEFLGEFLQSPARSAEEANALYRLSWLYRNNDLPDSAREALEKIEQFDPQYGDVAQLLADLRGGQSGRGSAMAFEKIVREDASFNRDRGVGARGATSAIADRLSNLPPLEVARTVSGPGNAAVAVVGAATGGLPGMPHAPAPPATQVHPYAAPQQYAGAPPPYSAAPPITGPHGTAVPPPYAVAPSPPSQAQPIPAPPPTTPEPWVAAQPAAPPHSAGTPSDEPSSLMVGSLPIGTVIDDRYELVREVGRGGMAAVYEAHDRELDERVAMKFFFGGDDQELLQRFKQELLLSRKLAHINIIKVFDIGTFRGCKFISMELLRGKSLTYHMHRKHSRDVLLNLLIQVCAGLHAAHEAGVVHRDVKPDNLFVTEKGVIKVMDFGIAKQQAKPGLTRAGYMAGTPHYMAPEQIFSFGSVDRRADIYALGILAYEMFCGQLPFQGDDMMQLLQLHLKEPPRPPRELAPDLPPALEAVILKCLAKKPEERFDNCRTLAGALQAVRNAK